jgi:hypothetical protein
MKLKPDLERLEAPFWVPRLHDESSLGCLIRWLAWVLDITISQIEEEMGLSDSLLHKAMKHKNRPLRGAVPHQFRAWLVRVVNYRMFPGDIQELSTMKGDEWIGHAQAIRRLIKKSI